ncbi:hypothetical protein ACWIGI_24650 [Nocardia sp. NPDC055321]
MPDLPLFHQMPDHPIMNLEVAQNSLRRHADCDDRCEAKRYFTTLVPHLMRRRTTWNIWAAGESESSPPHTGRQP